MKRLFLYNNGEEKNTVIIGTSYYETVFFSLQSMMRPERSIPADFSNKPQFSYIFTILKERKTITINTKSNAFGFRFRQIYFNRIPT